jgi:hypothetical protein
MHLDVIAAKNEVIHQLQRHLASLEELLKNPAPVNVKVEFPAPAPLVSTRPKASDAVHPERKPPSVTNWALVDVTDEKLMAGLAAEEFGFVPPPHVLARWYTQVRQQVQAAKLKEARQAAQTGTVGTVMQVPVVTESEAVQQGSSYVPSHIRELIERAENS